MGNVGTFVAHSLAARKSPPPVTLLLHNTGLYADYLARKKCLSINTNGLDDIKTGFDVNVLNDRTWYSLPYWKPNGETDHHDSAGVDEKLRIEEVEEDLRQSQEDDEKIESLIVAVKAPQTVNALKSVSHRLTPESTVLLLQNGMGTVEELNAKVFPDPYHRPHYMMGIVSHGLTRQEPFRVSHTAVGTTILSPLPARGPLKPAEEKDADWAPSTKYLLRTLTLTPPLVAVAETPTALLQYQLEKLAMNCVINPFTVLLDCENGELLYNYNITRAMRLLLIEISTVICALPELQSVPGINSRFSPERLRTMAVHLANKTGKNISSMLQDVRRGRETEIEYINGYIVRRGEELGIRCALNYLIMQLVHGKSDILTERATGAIPVDLPEIEEEE
jgi:2-dehydropantoate 2-reductase